MTGICSGTRPFAMTPLAIGQVRPEHLAAQRPAGRDLLNAAGGGLLAVVGDAVATVGRYRTTGQEHRSVLAPVTACATAPSWGTTVPTALSVVGSDLPIDIATPSVSVTTSMSTTTQRPTFVAERTSFASKHHVGTPWGSPPV